MKKSSFIGAGFQLRFNDNAEVAYFSGHPVIIIVSFQVQLHGVNC